MTIASVHSDGTGDSQSRLAAKKDLFVNKGRRFVTDRQAQNSTKPPFGAYRLSPAREE